MGFYIFVFNKLFNENGQCCRYFRLLILSFELALILHDVMLVVPSYFIPVNIRFKFSFLSQKRIFFNLCKILYTILFAYEEIN
ncbi:hypothetical protein NQ317_004332 [Molorchus minor]|uniref:Uncharacterized protein n=1 Tax=Molorchus minor TaxID=1323400 RepID=A0ABQ9JYF9_9CUCU|nr:hypothetical protein NQ317_004332 [Molorchus minor]